MMKPAALLGLCLSLAFASAPAQTLDRLWATEPVFKVPESVNFDQARNVLIVSNINGAPAAKDRNGFLSRMTPEGEILDLRWVTGLNAPKGAAIVGTKLYVTDVDVLVVVDIPRARVVKRIPLPGARFLNDAAAGPDGTIYVSDSSRRNSAIYRVRDDRPEVWLKSPAVRSPNGLAVLGGSLLIGNTGDGTLLHADLHSGKITLVAKVGFGIDGLKPAGDHGFLLSDWTGNVFLLKAGGDLVHLLKPPRKGVNAADVEYLPDRRVLYVPTFFDNRVVAYRLR